MIQKRHNHEDLAIRGSVQLTDELNGSGTLYLDGVGPSRWVLEPLPPGAPLWQQRGHSEWNAYRILGSATPEWERTFGLKLYPEGFVLSSSVAGATVFPTKAEAVALATRWLTEGGSGIRLESEDETAARKRVERSAYALTKIMRGLNGLMDEDLQRLSEAALKQITKRVENAAKEAAKVEAKRLKAAEKIRIAAEKVAQKQAAEEAKAFKAAEKIRMAAEKLAQKQAAAEAKAAKLAEKIRKQVERDAKKAAQSDVAVCT